jgi:hypothetical protein
MIGQVCKMLLWQPYCSKKIGLGRGFQAAPPGTHTHTITLTHSHSLFLSISLSLSPSWMVDAHPEFSPD